MAIELSDYLTIPDDILSLSPIQRWDVLFCRVFSDLHVNDPDASTASKTTRSVRILLELPPEILSTEYLDLFGADALTGVWRKTPWGLGDLFSGLLGVLAAPFKGLWTGIKGAASAVKAGFEKTFSWIGDHMKEVVLALIVIVIVLITGGAASPLVTTMAKFISTGVSAVWSVGAGLVSQGIRMAGTVKAVLDIVEVKTVLRLLDTTHKIASTFIPIYREWINNVFVWTRDVSQSVFGDSLYVFNGLTLLQMAVYDTSSLLGHKVDFAQNRYFSLVSEVAEMVSRKAKRYKLKPGEFWFDLTNQFIDREYLISVEAHSKQGRAVRALEGFTATLNRSLVSFNDRFLQYRTHMTGVIDKTVIKRIDTFYREYRRDVYVPFTQFRTKTTGLFEIVDSDLLDLKAAAEEAGARLKDVETTTANPLTLTPEDRDRQTRRITSILESVFPRWAPPAADSAAKKIKRIESLLERM